ncbi:double-strand break repair protein AddB [Rhizobium rhizosphaerae]|uniref:double-strand break repair protein AddB n=1 Tax=Xaviernesmea rhizosphaerae TaxID=1672749 RepID=UPI001FD9FA41|nr:double-strand break repair protein AddB [Xaviernesmea rhizosphaerae]
MAQPRQNILTIPPGAPFLGTLVDALCAGDLVPDFRYDPADPLSLADVTIFVPTRRAARVLRSEFVDRLGGQSAILPVVRPLGETEDDSGYFDQESPATLDLAPPIVSTGRLIELARLILAWRNRLPQVVRDVHGESALIAPASPADAIWLARDLSAIIDSVETEELDWEALKTLDAETFAEWWQLTLEFLDIARHFWPARLEELGVSSPARHRNAVIDFETARLRAGKVSGPVIVAGSTGSIPSTARLIAAIRDLPEGAIVLPGLDTVMSEAEWTAVAPEGALSGPLANPATRSHPQYGLFRLLERLERTREEVRLLGMVEPDLALRAATVSRALLPVEKTSAWGEAPEGDAALLDQAFTDVALIEATNEREEATAIAVAMRLSLEASDSCQAALITPDRDLAARVCAELMRFGIEADDTAGTPLSATPAGTLARLLLDAALKPGDPVAIAALIKHPLARFGQMRDAMRQDPAAPDRLALAGRLLERLALRGGTQATRLDNLTALMTQRLAEVADERHVPEWRAALTPEAVEEARTLAEAITLSAAPLLALTDTEEAEPTLADWARATGEALEAVAADAEGNLAELWDSEAGETLSRLLTAVIETDGQIEATGGQWADAMEALMAGEAIKPRAMRHPRVFVFGALEARLQSVDLIVLGGMNEGVWPGQTANDPFLSRAMKTGIGLEPPERRIGQLAHDFQMACGTRRLVLSRALRKGSAPTVASRWLQRLAAVLGKPLSDAMRARGHDFIEYGHQLDERPSQPLAPRPQPRPDPELQPTKYSFSEVTRLRRDPYAVYARRVLRLAPLDDFNADPGAAMRGTLYHAIVERFVRADLVPSSPEARRRLAEIVEEAFDAARLPSHIDVIWRPRFHGVAEAFLQWEIARHGEILRSHLEVPASLPLGVGQLRLTGIADRIDILKDGAAVIVDYKTGSNPSPKEARALLDPQLPLEAAALKRGAFKGVDRRETTDLLYVRLKPGDRFEVDTVNNERGSGRGSDERKSAAELADEAVLQLTGLLAALLSGRRGFVSRVIVQKERDYGGEYDHLARVAEWATAEAAEGENG